MAMPTECQAQDIDNEDIRALPQDIDKEAETIALRVAPLCREEGLGTTIWSPLASGLLSGKYNSGEIPEGSRAGLAGMHWLHEDLKNPDKMEKVRQISQLAAELGCSTAQLALAWCASSPLVSTVITGASNPSQVEENMKAVEIIPLLDSQLKQRIDSILS